jgi:4-carboxymuconolactone decarboxylase
MGIVAPVSLARATDEQKRIGEELFARLGGRASGPTALYLHNPGFAQLFDGVRRHIADGFSLPTRLTELCMCVTIRFWSAQYAWTVHGPAAVKAGISADAIEAIRTGGTPSFEAEDEETLYAYVSALLAREKIAPELEQRALALFGEVGLVELVAVTGVYSLVGQTCAAFDLPLADGVAPPLP